MLSCGKGLEDDIVSDEAVIVSGGDIDPGGESNLLEDASSTTAAADLKDSREEEELCWPARAECRPAACTARRWFFTHVARARRVSIVVGLSIVIAKRGICRLAYDGKRSHPVGAIDPLHGAVGLDELDRGVPGLHHGRLGGVVAHVAAVHPAVVLVGEEQHVRLGPDVGARLEDLVHAAVRLDEVRVVAGGHEQLRHLDALRELVDGAVALEHVLHDPRRVEGHVAQHDRVGLRGLRSAHPRAPAHAVADDALGARFALEVVDGVLDARGEVLRERVLLEPVHQPVGVVQVVAVREVHDHHGVAELAQHVGVGLGAAAVQAVDVRVRDDAGLGGGGARHVDVGVAGLLQHANVGGRVARGLSGHGAAAHGAEEEGVLFVLVASTRIGE
ncbi:hypothetical protein ON010_g13381 [Phytophthora cinnamomi]|nr:hypothetical protein ON010_g13381 [Phytophthora cinnamomi]